MNFHEIVQKYKNACNKFFENLYKQNVQDINKYFVPNNPDYEITNKMEFFKTVAAQLKNIFTCENKTMNQCSQTISDIQNFKKLLEFCIKKRMKFAIDIKALTDSNSTILAISQHNFFVNKLMHLYFKTNDVLDELYKSLYKYNLSEMVYFEKDKILKLLEDQKHEEESLKKLQYETLEKEKKMEAEKNANYGMKLILQNTFDQIESKNKDKNVVAIPKKLKTFKTPTTEAKSETAEYDEEKSPDKSVYPLIVRTLEWNRQLSSALLKMALFWINKLKAHTKTLSHAVNNRISSLHDMYYDYFKHVYYSETESFPNSSSFIESVLEKLNSIAVFIQASVGVELFNDIIKKIIFKNNLNSDTHYSTQRLTNILRKLYLGFVISTIISSEENMLRKLAISSIPNIKKTDSNAIETSIVLSVENEKLNNAIRTMLTSDSAKDIYTLDVKHTGEQQNKTTVFDKYNSVLEQIPLKYQF